MDEKKKNAGWDGSGAHNHPEPVREPGEVVQPYKTYRPKRRRVGQLNDGQWAPGYGPDAKKRDKPDGG